jgi:serine/threonine protein kinase
MAILFEFLFLNQKPSNILLNKEMDVKICDLGLSRGVEMEDPTLVVNRWYRSPELILMWEKCSKEIDVWSIGCVLFELIQDIPRKPVFPVKNYLDQLDIILQFTGTPKDDEIFACEKEKSYLSKLPLKLKKEISKHPLIPKSNILLI